MAERDERLRQIAEEAAYEALQTALQRSDMSRVLDCLNEGGRVREHYKSRFIWCVDKNGVSQGSVEPKVGDLLVSVGILESEPRPVRYPEGDVERLHYSLSAIGVKYIHRFGTVGEGSLPWIDLEELRESIAKAMTNKARSIQKSRRKLVHQPDHP